MSKQPLDLIVQSAARVLSDASAVIFTYDAEQGGFGHRSSISANGMEQPPTGDEPRPDGLGMRAIAQRRRVLSYEEKTLPIHPENGQRRSKKYGMFPLIVAAQPLGALYVIRQDERQFSQLELLMLENFVNQAAMAIYHTHNLIQVRHDLARKEEELRRVCAGQGY